MTSRFIPIRALSLLLALLLGCGGDPAGPSTGSLAVQVTGLPAGTSANLVVTGPEGFDRTLSSSETLTALTPGSYTVAASDVTSGNSSYVATPASQSVTVGPSDTPSSAAVIYGPVDGALTVTVVGLPPGTSAAVTVSGPNGFSQPVTATQTLTGLAPGSYVVDAAAVSSGGAQYTGNPATQTVSVAAGTTASAGVAYTTGVATGLNLRIDGLYLTQSVQTYSGSMPLVKGRDGYLRVFVTASQVNASAPTVRVRLYNSGVLASTMLINAPGASVPQSPNEGTLNSSWNIPVSKALIQPNLSILADVDPTNAVAESDEADNAFPASGTPLALDVRTTSTFSVHLIPVRQSANGLLGNVSLANKDQFLTTTMKIHPLAAYDADLGSTYTTAVTTPAVDASNSNGAWTTILGELQTRRTAEGGSRYYYGVLHPSYTSGVAGIGYIGGRVALGWDYLPSGADVAAHEWGHNWGRQHSPCGGASSPDPNYPYANAAIGVYGFDLTTSTLKPPTATDVMGYCGNQWISDYTYRGVLNYRAANPSMASAFSQAMQPCLLVWGRIVDGQPVLEPAFEVVTRPSLPAHGGPYTVEGRDAAGSRVFSLSFTPEQVADDPRGAQHFSFAVPLRSERAIQVAALRMAGGGREATTRRSYRMTAQMRSAPVAIEARRSAPGRVALRWDASSHPMVMVRDASTGEVLSLARDGTAELFTERTDLDLLVSNRVQSRQVRVVVPR